MFIDVNGGYRFGTLTFGETHTDLYFTENKSWTADYEVKSAPMFDVGGLNFPLNPEGTLLARRRQREGSERSEP